MGRVGASNDVALNRAGSGEQSKADEKEEERVDTGEEHLARIGGLIDELARVERDCWLLSKPRLSSPLFISFGTSSEASSQPQAPSQM